MLLNDIFALLEGNIAVADMDEKAREVVIKTMRAFCEETWAEYIERYGNGLDLNDGEDRSRLYDAWSDTEMSNEGQRQTFATAICDRVSKALTVLLADDELQSEKMLPPRKRSKRPPTKVWIETKERSADDLSKKFGGYYQDSYGTDQTIKVFIDSDTVAYAGSGAMQEVAFGEGEGIDDFAKKVVPIFIHEYTHFEQYRRGLSRNSARNYLSTNSEKKKKGRYYGGGWGDDPIAKMRYTASAHEIEAYAAGAAVELIQDIHRYSHQDFKVEASQIDDLCQGIAYSYADSSQMKRYLWLRQYRSTYENEGFKGEELEVVFKRFMKTLYKKLQQYKLTRIGKSKLIDPKNYPADWVRYTKYGLRDTLHSLAADIADKVIDNPDRNTEYNLLVKAEMFVDQFFFKDDHDWKRQMERGNKIGAALKRLIAAEVKRLEDIFHKHAA